jgi:hypothetical protein
LSWYGTRKWLLYYHSTLLWAIQGSKIVSSL